MLIVARSGSMHYNVRRTAFWTAAPGSSRCTVVPLRFRSPSEIVKKS